MRREFARRQDTVLEQTVLRGLVQIEVRGRDAGPVDSDGLRETIVGQVVAIVGVHGGVGHRFVFGDRVGDVVALRGRGP